MHREVAADPVAGAVIVVEPGLPQRPPREPVELRTGRAFRKTRGRQRDMALQYAGEVLAHLGGWRADRDGAGDVGGAVEVLRPGIEKIERPGLQELFGLGAGAVMHDRAVRAGAGDRREAEVTEVFALLAEGFEPVAGGDLLEPTSGRLARQPGEEARHRGAVAAMRLAGAVELDRVLACLGQHARVGGAVDLRARLAKPVEHPGGGARGIDLHPSRLGERIERGSEPVGRLDRHRVAEMAVETGDQLAAVDKQGHRAVGLRRSRRTAATACAARRRRGC